MKRVISKIFILKHLLHLLLFFYWLYSLTEQRNSTSSMCLFLFFSTTLCIVYTSIVLKQNGKNDKIQKYQCKTVDKKLKNDSQHKCKLRIVVRLEPKEYTNPHYIRHMWNATSKSNVELKSNFRLQFSRRFGKVVFNLKQLIKTSHLKAVTSRIKLGTCEIQCLNWVMATVSSITINTGRYAMIHLAFFMFL